MTIGTTEVPRAIKENWDWVQAYTNQRIEIETAGLNTKISQLKLGVSALGKHILDELPEGPESKNIQRVVDKLLS